MVIRATSLCLTLLEAQAGVEEWSVYAFLYFAIISSSASPSPCTYCTVLPCFALLCNVLFCYCWHPYLTLFFVATCSFKYCCSFSCIIAGSTRRQFYKAMQYIQHIYVEYTYSYLFPLFCIQYYFVPCSVFRLQLPTKQQKLGKEFL